MFGAIVLTLTLIGVLLLWWRERRDYARRLARLKVRIYVNGIRGKSTVTRLVAGVLREAGIQTLAKTTGSAAMVILPNGDEVPIIRASSPTIFELFNISRRYLNDATEATVYETMAIHPDNQIASQELLVRGNVNIITNVREDHQEVMGRSLGEIADTLSLMIPRDGVLITSESHPELREQLGRNAERRGSRMIFADPATVTDADLAGFDYLTFRDNVAIGLAVAELLGIPRSTAIRGMWNARPDVGVVNIQRTNWKGCEFVWVPLFAVNDRESTILGLKAVEPYYRKDATRFGILNNRPDRAERALQFANIAAKDVEMDYWITFGAYESQVTRRMCELGVPAERIFNLGFSVNPTLEQIFDRIRDRTRGSQAVIVGMVNIHTPQAELMMGFFRNQPDAPIHVREEEARKRYRPQIERAKEMAIGHLAKRG